MHVVHILFYFFIIIYSVFHTFFHVVYKLHYDNVSIPCTFSSTVRTLITQHKQHALSFEHQLDTLYQVGVQKTEYLYQVGVQKIEHVLTTRYNVSSWCIYYVISTPSRYNVLSWCA